MTITLELPVLNTPPDPAMPIPDSVLTAAFEFPREAASVPEARKALHNTLVRWGIADTDLRDEDPDRDNALLLLSELVTNGVEHVAPGAGDKLEVAVALWGVLLRVSVFDPDRDTAAYRATPRDSAESGRGIWLVQAISHRYGAYKTEAGKCTWFELLLGGA